MVWTDVGSFAVAVVIRPECGMLKKSATADSSGAATLNAKCVTIKGKSTYAIRDFTLKNYL